jgi:phage internal scaffolding protein
MSNELNSFYHPRKPALLYPDGKAGELVTKQEFKDECDIYTILGTYARTGQLTHLNSMAGTFQDLPPDTDYQAAMNTIIQAQDAFAALPATIRDRYHNDPAEFLAAIDNPDERPYLTEQGVFKQPVPVAPPVTAAPAAPPSAAGASS